MQIGKITIIKESGGIWLQNDGEGMKFSEQEFEALMKELLYKHF